MPVVNKFKAGDTAAILEVTCVDAVTGLALDLTGATVKLMYSIRGTAKVSKTMTVTDPTHGIARYQFLASDLIAGWMVYEIEVTDVGTKIQTSLTNSLEIEARIA